MASVSPPTSVPLPADKAKSRALLQAFAKFVRVMRGLEKEERTLLETSLKRIDAAEIQAIQKNMKPPAAPRSNS
ncbi:hypothetical protein HY734_03065 [Candidatus Uhrbacteria bacterium]|nr:hypothetical protein [Candidatus Uhrbacteria bacterium]